MDPEKNSQPSSPKLLVPFFLLGYLPTATGQPFQCLDLLMQLERNASPELLVRSRELLDSLRSGNRETVDNVRAVEALLQYVQLAAPPRPQTPTEYFAWLTQIRKSVPDTVEPMSQQAAVLSVGFFLANLLVTIQVKAAALTLLAAAPDNQHVHAQLATSTQGIHSICQNLELALRHPAPHTHTHRRPTPRRSGRTNVCA